MTKVTYTGKSDARTISGQDYPEAFTEMGEDAPEEFRWTPGSNVDVPDAIAQHLTEYHRTEFVLYDDPKGRDHRTKEELLAEATELNVKGRSSMTKDELRDAIYARREENAAGSEEGDEPSVASTESQELDPTEGGPPHEGQSSTGAVDAMTQPQGTPGTVEEV